MSKHFANVDIKGDLRVRGRVGGDLTIQGDVTSDAFYLSSGGEVSTSGSDLLVKSTNGNVTVGSSTLKMDTGSSSNLVFEMGDSWRQLFVAGNGSWSLVDLQGDPFVNNRIVVEPSDTGLNSTTLAQLMLAGNGRVFIRPSASESFPFPVPRAALHVGGDTLADGRSKAQSFYINDGGNIFRRDPSDSKFIDFEFADKVLLRAISKTEMITNNTGAAGISFADTPAGEEPREVFRLFAGAGNLVDQLPAITDTRNFHIFEPSPGSNTNRFLIMGPGTKSNTSPNFGIPVQNQLVMHRDGKISMGYNSLDSDKFYFHLSVNGPVLSFGGFYVTDTQFADKRGPGPKVKGEFSSDRLRVSELVDWDHHRAVSYVPFYINNELSSGEVVPPQVFSAYTTSTANVTAGAEVPWNVEWIKDSNYTHSADAEEVTVLSSGLYRINGQVSTDKGGGVNRILTRVFLRNNGSEVVGTRCWTYNRGQQSTNKGTASFETIMKLNENDELTVFAEAEANPGGETIVLVSGGSRLNIEKIR